MLFFLQTILSFVLSRKITVSYTKRNEQAFIMKENEEVNRDLFHIRVWYIKKHLRNISGPNSRNVKEL